MGDLGPRRSPGSWEGTEHELSSEAGSPERCVAEARINQGCESEACHGTTGIVIGGESNAVQPPVDEFVVERPLTCNCEGVGQSTEKFGCPCIGHADSVHPGNDTGESVPMRLQPECENENDVCFLEDGGRVSALEGDCAIGTLNKALEEESDLLCLSSSGILLGGGLQNSSDIVSGIGGVLHFEGDKRSMECEVDIGSARLTNVTGIEGGLVSFGRDKGCYQCESSIVRKSSLTTVFSSISTSPKLVDEFYCNSMPQDNRITSVKSGTKWFEEPCGNSSEAVQHIDNKDESEVYMGPSAGSNFLEQDLERLKMDVSVEQTGKKETDTSITNSEDRNTLASTCPEEQETACQVHQENKVCQASFIKKESCDLVQGLPSTVISSCTSTDLGCLQPFHQSNAMEVCSSCLHSVSGGKGDSVAATISSIFCGCAAECTQADSGGKDEPNSGSVLVVRRRNPKRAASSRNNECITKCDPPTGSSNSAKKGRLAVNICALLSCGTFKRVTKKRCHSWKRARISVWGELGNLLELFKHNNVLGQTKSKGSQNGRCHRSGRRQLTNRRAGTSKKPRVKHTVSTSCVSLTDEMGQQNLAASSQTSLHSNAIDCSHNSELLTIQGLPKAVNADEIISVTGGCTGQLSCHHENMESRVLSYEQHAHHGDKDPESCVTQEASVENNVCDSLGVHSRVGQGVEVSDGRVLVDPGTSPDSGVLNSTTDAGNITNESATSTSHEPSSRVEPIGQHAFDLGSPVQEDLHFSVLSYSQVPTSVPMQSAPKYTYSKKAKSGKIGWKKNGVMEENGCLSSDNSFEGTSQGPSSLLKAEKSSRSRPRQGQKNDFGLRKVTKQRSNVKASEDIQTCEGLSAENPYLAVTDSACCEGSLMSEHCLGVPLSVSTRTAGLHSMIPETLSSSSVGKEWKPRGGNKTRARKGNNLAQRRSSNVNTQKKDTTNNLVSRRKAKQKVVPDQVTILEECQLDDALNAEQGVPFHHLSGRKKNLTMTKTDELEKENILQNIKPRDDESNSGDNDASKHTLSSFVASVNHGLPMKGSSHSFEGQVLPKRSAWVRCDDCYKWRSIPVELADIIDETNCRWTCKDNSDKAFADCTIPQGKTNAEINAELEISDASCEEDCFTEQNCRGSEVKSKASQQASWVLINSNIFLHRMRKTQTIDEIMVCQCKPPLDGSLGCGDECLNRVLNIECVPGTCPCGNLCSNQKFQKRNYAKFKWFRCGKKGFGLQLLEDVSQGQFLIEYVGEVLDLATYEARQREYALRGQKHFYFMTLNGNEVIDACAKGNLGRFINHSCEPNCRTEKWMVNGEVCIGLFAIGDIRKGEEVTFDYNYVRVFGAAAKRCVCGSAECRGYIGGDPSNTENIVQGDSDEEYPEPVMIIKDGDTDLKVDEIIPESTDATDLLHEISAQSAGKASKPPVGGPTIEAAVQNDGTSLISSSDGQLLETVPLAPKSKEVTDPFLDNNKYRPITNVNNARTLGSPLHSKSSHSSCLVKKKSCSSKKSVMQRGKKSSAISLTQSTVCRAGHFDGVEEKLNELLDAQGGISKRRDATKGYLKLLFLTASSGDNVKSETSQSTRDLSLILDAILKTKSRTVLVDIINKNGLQMLHNIMKQNRNFNKIPILRKLLKKHICLRNEAQSQSSLRKYYEALFLKGSSVKVLEFLAVRGILTPEHINNIPSHVGVESFKESIIKLTYHNDVQVHQMARNFRDKWLPRTIRKVHLSDREDGWLTSKFANSDWFLPLSSNDSQIQWDTDAICISQPDSDLSPPHGTDAHPEARSFCSQLASTSVPSGDVSSTVVAKPRKRKSRWDQPSDAPSVNSQVQSIEGHTAKACPKVMRYELGQTELEPHRASKSGQEAISLGAGTISHDDMILMGVEEVPPGFGTPASNTRPWIQSETSMIYAEVVAGHPQERYLPQLTVSYGIPLALVEQLGSPDAEGSENWHHHSWEIAPGMPFHPFPPLPPYPRGETRPASGHSMMVAESREETRPTDSASGHLDPSTTAESAERASMALENGAVNQQAPDEMNGLPNGSVKKFFRPHRWNGHRYEKFGPPWLQERNGCKSRGTTRNGMSGVAVGTVQKTGRGPCFPEGVRAENVSPTFSEVPHQVQ